MVKSDSGRHKDVSLAMVEVGRAHGGCIMVGARVGQVDGTELVLRV